MRPDAAAAVAKSHRVAKELDEAEFEALEENFFDACARAIAPIARNYTKAQAAIANAVGSSGEGSPDAGSPERGVPEEGEPEEGEPAAPSEKDAQRALVEKRRQGAIAETAAAASQALGQALHAFGQDLSQATRKTTLRTIADVSLGDVHSFGEMICCTGWDRDAEYIATAGISKRLRIFEVDPLINSGAAVHCPVAEMKASAKLSSMTWNPYIKHTVATADYEGVVSLWDVNRGGGWERVSRAQEAVWSTSWSSSIPRDSSPEATTAPAGCGPSTRGSPPRLFKTAPTSAACTSPPSAPTSWRSGPRTTASRRTICVTRCARWCP